MSINFIEISSLSYVIAHVYCRTTVKLKKVLLLCPLSRSVKLLRVMNQIEKDRVNEGSHMHDKSFLLFWCNLICVFERCELARSCLYIV